ELEYDRGTMRGGSWRKRQVDAPGLGVVAGGAYLAHGVAIYATAQRRQTGFDAACVGMHTPVPLDRHRRHTNEWRQFKPGVFADPTRRGVELVGENPLVARPPAPVRAAVGLGWR